MLWQPGWYHEDMGTPRCVQCGTVCPIGYMTDTHSQLCNNNVYTADLVSASDKIAYIGCTACPLPLSSDPMGISFVQGCQFACVPPSVTTTQV